LDSEVLDNLEYVLHQYGIPMPLVKSQNLFFREICRIVIDRKRKSDSLNCSCIFDLLHNLPKIEPKFIEKLIQLIAVTNPSEIGLRRLCEILRGGGSDCFPLEVHPFLYKSASSILLQDSLSVIKLPGDINSYVHLQSLPLLCPDCFAVTLWYKFGSHQTTENEIRLFRCRTPHGGIECLVLAHDPSSHTFQLRLKSHSTSGVHRGSGSVDFELKPLADEWNGIVITQSNPRNEIPSLQLYLNGSLVLDQLMPYPFGDTVGDSNWSFGSGLQALCSGIGIYREKFSQTLSRFLFDGGPTLPSLHSVVSIPLSSVESGNTMLGTSHTKGEAAVKASKSKILYSFTPNHFVSQSLLPASTTGTLFLEYMEMSKIGPEGIDAVRIPMLTGLCEVECHASWLQTWLNIGGTSTLLYLLWDYFLAAKAHTDHRVDAIRGLISFLSTFLRASVDAREKFLQEHGFHIISAGLYLVDLSLLIAQVDDFECFKALVSAATSASGGDELTAAFQGFLFDFNLWGTLKIEIQSEILTFILHLSERHPAVLYQGIGIHKILTTMDAQLSTHSLSLDLENVDLLATRFSDLLSVAVRQSLSLNSNPNPSLNNKRQEHLVPDICLLISTIEVSCCSLTIERIFQIFHSLRQDHPELLEECLLATRYAETAALRLCTSGVPFSLQVRRDSFLLLLWQLQRSIHNLTIHLLSEKPIFGQLHLDLSKLKPLHSGGVSLGGASAAMEYNRRSTEISQAAQTIKLMKSKVASMQKIWILVNMIAIEFDEAIPRAGWPCPSTEGEFIPVCEMMDLFLSHGSLGKINSMILLPFLSPLLSRCSERDHTSQLLLQDFANNLKENETFVAVLALLPETAWLQPILILFDLDLQEIDRRPCFEQLLDLISEVLLYRIRYFGSAAIETVKTCTLSLDCTVRSIQLLPQTILLCLQKLTQQNPRSWNRGSLISLGSLMSFIEDKQICGNTIVFRKPTQEKPSLSPHEGDVDLQQLMIRTLIAFLGQLKVVGSSSAFGPREVKVVLPIIRILIGYLQAQAHVALGENDSTIVDEVCVALLGTLPHMTEQWTYFSPEAFRDMILSIIAEFKTIIDSSDSSNRDKFISVVMAIVQYFAQYDQIPGNTSPIHVALIAEILIPVQFCGDIDTIFLLTQPQDSSPNGEEDTLSPVMETKPTPVTHQTGMIFTIRNDDEDDYEEIDESTTSEPLDPSREIESIPSQNSPSDCGEESHPIFAPIGVEENPPLSVKKKHSFLPSCVDEMQVGQRRYYESWRNLRMDALREKVEAELIRSTRMNDLHQYDLNVTKIYLKGLRNKTQLEIFLEEKEKEWKLGVSHEGSFPGRKRVILRPKYDVRSACVSYHQYSNQDATEEKENGVIGTKEGESLRVQDIDQILLQSSPGVIIDVISSGPSTTDAFGVGDSPQSEDHMLSNDTPLDDEDQLYSGIDAGMAMNLSQPSRLLGRDSILMDHIPQHGYINTGPDCPGSKRNSSEAPILEANTILICPSGSYPGTITLTLKEIYFLSSSLDTSSPDIADVSLRSPGSKIRRRKWALLSVNAVYLRRYRLRDTAIEVFLSRGKHKSFLLDFGSKAEDSKRRNNFVTEFVKHIPKSAVKQSPDTSTQK
jgi:hypothetical protein